MKYLIVILLIIISFPCLSQDNGFCGSYSISAMTLNPGHRNGFSLGLYFTKDFSKTRYFQQSLIYNQRGSGANPETDTSKYTRYDNNLKNFVYNYIEFPSLFFIRQNSFNIGFGVSPAFLVMAKKKYKIDYDCDGTCFGFGDIKDYYGLDIVLLYAIRYKFKRFSIEARYNYGLIAIQPGNKTRSLNIGINLPFSTFK